MSEMESRPPEPDPSTPFKLGGGGIVMSVGIVVAITCVVLCAVMLKPAHGQEVPRSPPLFLVPAPSTSAPQIAPRVPTVFHHRSLAVCDGAGFPGCGVPCAPVPLNCEKQSPKASTVAVNVTIPAAPLAPRQVVDIPATWGATLEPPQGAATLILEGELR